MGQELTTANKILVSASHIAETQETFTAEDLIVRAWQQFPESFGLSGYREKFPDSNRVLSKLMGSVGLCSRGWLEQVSTKTYRMTPAGRKLATALRSNGDANAIADAMDKPRPAPPRAEREEKPARVEKIERVVVERAAPVEVAAKPRVREPEEIRPTPAKTIERPAAAATRSVVPTPAPARPAAAAAAVASAPAAPMAARTPSAPVRSGPILGGRNVPGASNFEGLHVLQRLATSVASQKFSRGGLVTFQDACQFWAITPAIHPTHLQPRLTEIENLLKRAEQFVQQTAQPIRVHDRLEITMTTVIGLQGLHRMLVQRYHRELENIRAKATSNDAEG